MGNNNLKTTNEVLIKVDQNNLVYIDPNTVLSNGVVQPRDVEPENLVMYVNLEADLVPRSVLINNDNKSTLTSVASGTLNFMKNADGRDYDTNWTESFTTLKQNSLYIPSVVPGGLGMSIPISASQNDETAQSFGITDINIEVKGANFIPRVVIKFVDVRGKTLFESPANSPYAAFFHLPWPIFYLTVKGYYGKAIRYRLHLIKFNSKYNPSNGNFEIECNFVGSTYAYLADISMECVMNAAYFYPSEDVVTTEYDGETKTYKKTVKKSTKGYRVLKSVYQEYINKGLLPSDFPVRTLREIIKIAGRLNTLLEKEIFQKVVNHKVLAGVKSFEEDITSLENSVLAWKSKRLSSEAFTLGQTRQDPITGISEKVYWNTLSASEKNSMSSISGATTTGTLENIVFRHVEKLESNQAFGVKRKKDLAENDKIKTSTISCAALKDIKDFYRFYDGKVGVDIDGLLDQIYLIQKNFIEQRNKLEDTIEREMNNFVKDKKFGIGFEPSVRNIIGVMLANAEVYIRLMKDVHEKAFDKAQDRKQKLASVLTDSFKQEDAIYPWPEIKEKTSGGKELVLVYPGSEQMVGKLEADNKSLWPEVEFVENFYEIAIKKSDNLSGNEGDADQIDYLFDNEIGMNKQDLSVLTNIINFVPYTDKSLSSILYELYERAKYTTSLNPFTNNAIRELANIEYENLQNQVLEDEDIVNTLKKNVKNYSDLISQMESIITKYPYYEDQLPTVGYISDGLLKDFKIEKYEPNTITSSGDSTKYTKVSEFLNNYKAEEYRKKIYPFNSTTYQSYLNQSENNILKSSNLSLNKLLHVDVPENFIASLKYPAMWVKDGFINNLFANTIKINGINKHILNTPYFHKQLYSEFINSQVQGKYVGSAYLLLNSLPFKELDDQINNTAIQAFNQAMLGFSLVGNDSTLVSTVFREIAATHYIPYHMMLKWGAIYHRYKKFLTENIDIISNVTDAIDGGLFFDNNDGITYNTIPDTQTGIVKTVSRINEIDIGFHPYYSTIFYQIVNGFGYYNTSSAASSYSEMISSGVTHLYYQETNNGNLWTSFVDDSKFRPTLISTSQLENISREQAYELQENYTYTLLPSNGYNTEVINSFSLSEQENFRILWNIGTPSISDTAYTTQTFPSYDQYFISAEAAKEYSLGTNYRKVIDLIATFKPDILEAFELAFIDFASEKLVEDSSYNPYNMKYNKFQDLLKKIVTVKKNDNDAIEVSNAETITTIKGRQSTILSDLTSELLSNDNLIKLTLGNPREVDNYILGGFTNIDVKHFSINPFDMSGYLANLAKVELYLGDDMDGYYSDFFITNNIEASEENIKQFRPLIYMFAGKRASDGGATLTKTEFVEYLKDNVVEPSPISIGSDYVVSSPPERLKIFLDQLISKIQETNFKTETDIEKSYIRRGYKDDPIKLETYNYFKSFNDKWSAGNSIGQRTLMEEFLFLDKANKDIGSSVFLNMEKLLRLEDKNNAKINLYSAISLLIQDTGFDIRALPAYVNFYGNNFSNTTRIMPSKSVAQSIFGTFLDIDYQEASPKIILQYVGPTSKHLELSDINKKYLYKDDGFDVGNVNNNPILIAPDVFTKTDFSKSNKCVAFEVSFGDQNQSIFKSVELDQSTIKNTSESFIVYENLGRSEGGGSTAQVDIGLYDIYRQASYQCTVSCMGDVMIQPTMYFYLKNVPLFRGSYWITEVSHTISPRGIETKFKGTRIPQQALPKPEDSFMASYRSLFDRMVKRADIKLKEEEAALLSGKTGNEQTIIKPDGTATSVKSDNIVIPNEKRLTDVGYTVYGIPYNGADSKKDTDIKLVEYNGTQWLRATAIGLGGKTYPGPLDPGVYMKIISNTAGKITWGELRKYNATQDFYFSKFAYENRFNELVNSYKTTEFFNPNPRERIYNNYSATVTTSFNLSTNTYQGPVHVGPLMLTSQGYLETGYGIALSQSLMKKLHLYDGDVVYFKLH